VTPFAGGWWGGKARGAWAYGECGGSPKTGDSRTVATAQSSLQTVSFL
jgi:hypothetical protein